MIKKLIAAGTLLAIPMSAVAGPIDGIAWTSFANQPATAVVTDVKALKRFRSVRRAGATKKSDRQKCLDMMLPQDGVDCLKKLKAKKK